jgi:hypothetical protein
VNIIKAIKYIGRKDQYELQDVAILNYNIDGIWLDEALEQKYPNQRINELIPSLLYKFDDNEIVEYVSENIFPKPNHTTICPILTCNQGCGLKCTNVVAEIENKGDKIIWKRLGLCAIGSDETTQWLDSFSKLEFTFEEYNNLREDFKTLRKANNNL